jgi:outer membrane biosynthesis protein TonB
MVQIWRIVRVAAVAALFWGVTATTIFPQQLSPPERSLTQQMQLTIEVLSSTHGTDLKDYLGVLEASLQRNWFVVMPESALLGKKGVVTLVFHIQPDGKLLADDPKFQSVSGREAFDKAAADSIRNSAPFDRLPAGLHSRNLALRIVFYYNVPVDSPKGTADHSKTHTVTMLAGVDGASQGL